MTASEVKPRYPCITGLREIMKTVNIVVLVTGIAGFVAYMYYCVAEQPWVTSPNNFLIIMAISIVISSFLVIVFAKPMLAMDAIARFSKETPLLISIFLPAMIGIAGIVVWLLNIGDPTAEAIAIFYVCNTTNFWTYEYMENKRPK